MGLKEIIQNLGEKQKARKEKIRLLDEEIRLQKLVQDRMKSANERELERFMEENRQENIKKMLEVMRKKRQRDINFNHNPLNTPNIMKAKWEVLKERNMFKNPRSSILNQEFIHKGNSNLFKNNRRLFNI
ncbi:MAG TPA: hypothetical protein ENG48_02670 [Candidatus Atribacteria bacterium]|nr:hypothetical protein [Candidatus Atribacteria bacterium]